jgi:hypothetical protein
MRSDENQTIATLQAERMRASFIANGFPQPLTCPFCRTDQVRREDPRYREFKGRRGKMVGR